MKQWCAYHPNNFVSWKLERTIEQRSINRIFIWTCHLFGILLIYLDSLPWYRARGDCIWFKQKRMKKVCIFPNIWVNQLFRFGAPYICLYIYILSYIVIYSTVIEHLIILDHGSCPRDPKGPPEFQSSHASSQARYSYYAAPRSTMAKRSQAQGPIRVRVGLQTSWGICAVSCCAKRLCNLKPLNDAAAPHSFRGGNTMQNHHQLLVLAQNLFKSNA